MFLDQYSLLHFAVGVLFYFWNISLVISTLAHATFGILGNSESGSSFVRKYIPAWPGGKPRIDNYLNLAGDSVSFMAGWGAAKALDDYGSANGWYDRHSSEESKADSAAMSFSLKVANGL